VEWKEAFLGHSWEFVCLVAGGIFLELWGRLGGSSKMEDVVQSFVRLWFLWFPSASLVISS